ncbi:hypothetical protein QOT17_005987 [Balamuthia mandrillaris]
MGNCLCGDDVAQTDERQPLLFGPTKKEREQYLEAHQELIVRLQAAREEAVYRAGGSQEALAFAQAVQALPAEMFTTYRVFVKEKLVKEALDLIDQATRARASLLAGSGESDKTDSWINRLCLEKGRLLYFQGKPGSHAEAFAVWDQCLRVFIDEDILEQYASCLVSLDRANDVNELCKEHWPHARSQEEQLRLLRAFHKHTTLAHKVAYEWAPPTVVDSFVKDMEAQYGGDSGLRTTRQTIYMKEREGRKQRQREALHQQETAYDRLRNMVYGGTEGAAVVGTPPPERDLLEVERERQQKLEALRKRASMAPPPRLFVPPQGRTSLPSSHPISSSSHTTATQDPSISTEGSLPPPLPPRQAFYQPITSSHDISSSPPRPSSLTSSSTTITTTSHEIEQETTNQEEQTPTSIEGEEAEENHHHSPIV